MEQKTLNGHWELIQAGSDQPIPASVPGCVHTDLLAAGLIEAPFYRDNELRLLWIGEADWLFRRTFTVDAALLQHDAVRLRCHGLDTLATIRLNGDIVAHTDNMYRTWEFDVRSCLQTGTNTLEIRFDSALNYVHQRERDERVLPAWGVGQHKLDGGGWIRKQPSNFGWDWGPMLLTCGIWRDIELVAYDTARLQDVHVMQDHRTPGQVGLTVRATAEQIQPSASLSATCTARLNGEVVAEASAPLVSGRVDVALTIADPQLWWPNELGDQPLYDLSVQLSDASGATLDTQQQRIGLRTLRLDRHPDQWGESFQFAVNGVPFFAKGANWIPADTFVTRLTAADYRRLLDDTVGAHMNMLRVWGGGIYEDDVFYDLCDELGICIWQDFMFACATYPAFDEDFMTNVKAEAEDNVRRIRHHPSLALWCGNNELEQGLVGDTWTATSMSWEDYSKLYDQLLPEVVAALDPQTDYWPCSPHTPVGDRRDFNNPHSGDAHLWSVWHGRQPFEWYRTCEHRFNSEFGFQSFTEPDTTYAYTEPQDRNITSFVMEHHQRSGIGNSTIIHYMLDWFRLPTSFDMTLWLSQVLQGMGIKYAVEHWRRAMPRGMGTLYWQINDCWPVASWSSIDFYGRWKALHYMARRFYQPLLLSAVEDLEQGTVDVHLTNDERQAQTGEVRWLLTDLNGQMIEEGSLDAAIGAQESQCIQTLDLSQPLAEHGARNLLLWVWLVQGDALVSSNFVSFVRPKHLELPDPQISLTVHDDEDGVVVRLEAQRPALWAWITIPGVVARYSDNFVHLLPGQPVEIEVSNLPADLTPEAIQSRIKAYSLVDTYV
ncbi:MAG: glycoside hydrolase family 2 protein [Anaerolineae bacterium]|nr:glycoside hydrolase family 2 protein [Anaerolineae bacterium]